MERLNLLLSKNFIACPKGKGGGAELSEFTSDYFFSLNLSLDIKNLCLNIVYIILLYF